MNKKTIHLAAVIACAAFLMWPLSTTAANLPPKSNEELLIIDSGLPKAIRSELLNVAPVEIDLSGKEPTVLIYHTHTTEAYTATSDAPYVETSAWRTTDPKNNVVAVGDALTNALQEYGIKVVHDTTNHEPPKLSTAYERSLATMQKYKEQYPSIEIYIDIHRDAMGPSQSTKEGTDWVMIDGKKMARFGFVVGTGESYAEKPDYKENYAIVKAVYNQLNIISPSITRSIFVKTGRYNQHVGRCLLINIGHDQNTLEEALNATQYLAKAIAKAAGKG